MKKKGIALPAAAVFFLLSASGTVAAEDMIYYGSGDGNNTGDISGLNQVLNKDYSFYGGHQIFYNAYTKSGATFNNTLTINGGTYTVGGDDASGKYSNYFYDALSRGNGNATGNSIVINGGNFINESGTWQAAGIYTAQATGTGYEASDNSITVNGGTFQGYTYISPGLGYDGADAAGNTVTINDGNFEKGVYIFGGRAYSTGNTDNNTVNVTGGTIGGYRAFIWGGKADSGDARCNIVNLTGGTVASMPAEKNIYENQFVEYEQGDAEFYGGYTLYGNALYNTVNISGGSISTAGYGLAYGGYSRAGNANYNTVNVTGGNISSRMVIVGGFAAAGDASGNTVIIKGGSGTGEVYLSGGVTKSSDGNATGNKIAVYVPANLTDVYGGLYLTGNDTDGFEYNITNSGDLFTGNELYLASSGITANNIYNFETLNFYLPSSYLSGSTILTLSDWEVWGTDLTNTNVVLSAAGDASLAKGQTINLISSQGELRHGSQTEGILKQGVSLNYNYTLVKDAGKLQAVLEDVQVNDETKSPAETRAAQSAFLNRGADLLVTDGILQAEKESGTAGKWSPFFAMQGGKHRYRTGSHVDGRGISAILGAAGKIEKSGGKLIFGLAGEYGKGSYDSYYGHMHGQGDSDYAGATIFARLKNAGGMYYEGSFRAGRTKADYSSRDFKGYEGTATGYDTDGNYLGAHLGLGRIIKSAGKNEFDVSFRYFYSRTGSDSARLSTGETYNFSAVNSHRLRLGARLTHTFHEGSKGCLGTYFEREFDGDAGASVAGYSTLTPSLKGNRGIFEIGWLHQPKKSNFTLNLGVTAACGNQRGVAGNLGLMWKF